jgi:hypothetical protein
MPVQSIIPNHMICNEDNRLDPLIGIIPTPKPKS